MPSTMDAAAFPAVMEFKLRRIRRRLCALAIGRGAALSAGALILGMLIAINIDGWFMLLHTEVRLALTAATLLLAGAILVMTTTGPVCSSWRLRAVAEAVDRHVPHLEQRWTTVTHVATGDRRHQGLAAAMVRLVTNEAAAMAQLVNPARIATVANLRRATMWLIGTVVLLGLFLASDWQHHRILMQRFWMPLSPISATRIHSETGDIVLPRGEPLAIMFTLSGIPRNSASLLLIHDDGRNESIELQIEPENSTRVAYHLPSLNGSFRYRAQSGDGRSGWYRVTAIDRPALIETRLKLTAPQYVQRPVYEKSYLPQRLNAFEGSHLSLEFRPAEPLSRFELRLDSPTGSNGDSQADFDFESRHHLLLAGDDGWYRYETILEGDVNLSPLLLSPHGLTNENSETCHIRVITDRPPIVQITHPTEEAVVSPDEVIEVTFEAHDDHGIAQAELVVYRETLSEDKPAAILSIEAIPLEDQQNAKHVSAIAQLDLSKFDLSIGERLSYAVRVSDNRPVARPPLVPEGDPEEVTDSPSPSSENVTSTESPSSDLIAHAQSFAADGPIESDDLQGHDSESNRLRLRIVQRTMVSSNTDDNRQTTQMAIRQRIEQIDGELESAEMLLESIWEGVSSTPLDGNSLRELADADARLAKVDRTVADLRAESKETPYAFVGLQMVDIGSSYITPARDHVFAVIHQPNADAERSIAEANHRVNRARELLAELLARYERAVREQEFADSLENVAEIHEVYVANMQRLLRAQSAPSPNPLERSMAILDYDQEYLDRLREVIEMRRDLMAELGRILADDPRLLGKFMDIMKRRQTSLRDQLTRLHQRQLEIAEELAGWQLVDESQREAVWVLAMEMRLHELAPLARDISQFESHTVSQLPLELDPKHRFPAAVIERVNLLAVQARSVVAKSRRLLADPFDDRIDLVSELELMEQILSDLDTAFELLESEHPGEETAAFVTNRKAESRALAEQVSAWTEIASHVPYQRYHGLAAVDQRRLAIHTEQLRLAMQDVDILLPGGLQGEIPTSIRDIADELKRTIEAVTFNQGAAAFGLGRNELADSQAQQELALAGFERAEELFDHLRRMVIEELDQTDLDVPNAADLVDPTFDEFLERLEREPDLNALLGIPDRPTNLRRTSDWMQWSEGAGAQDDLNVSAQRARQRAEEQEEWEKNSIKADDEVHDLTEQQWQEIADADAAQEMIQQRIDELRRQSADPSMDEEKAERLRRAAEQLEEMQRQLATRGIGEENGNENGTENGTENGNEAWRQLVRSEQMQAILRATARGEPVPDSQWIQILSSLGDGLWQVRRRTPPEGYRQAIEQYQDRIRKLRSLEVSDTGQP